jgi:2-dehydropantoate 2-reductase
MKVLIFGTGGVGCIYAYILEQAGAHVTTVCRSNYEAVASKGIAIESGIFGNVTSHPTAVRKVEDAQGPFDYILVCAKNFPGQAHLISAAVSPLTSIVLCQNGIDIEAEYATTYLQNTIISGVVYLPTTQISPGIVKMGPLQLLHIGTYPATAPESSKASASRFAQLFTRGGGAIKLHDNVQPARWIKLAVNVGWSPTCAVSRCDDANFMRSSAYAEPAVRVLMGEVGRVADAVLGEKGVVSQAEINEQLERPRKRLDTGGKEPSMLTDVRADRALEVEAILGNCVRRARQVGVETPVMDVVYALATGLNFSIVKPEGEWKPIA